MRSTGCRRRPTRGPVLAWAACLAAGVLWHAPARAQAPDAGQPAAEAAGEAASDAPVIVPIPVEEVPGRVEQVRSELKSLLPKQAARDSLDQLGEELDPVLAEIKRKLKSIRAGLEEETDVPALRRSELELTKSLARLEPIEKNLAAQLDTARQALERIDVLAETWKQTAELAREKDAIRFELDRSAEVRREIDGTRAEIVAWRNEIVVQRDRLVDPKSEIRASLDRVRGETQAVLKHVFEIDRPPLWSAELRQALGEQWQTNGPANWLSQLVDRSRMWLDHWRRSAARLALFAVLVLAMRALRDRARSWAEDDYDLREAKEVFELPWAMALLLAVILVVGLRPQAVAGMTFLSGLAVAVGVLAIGRRFLVPALAPLAWGMVGLFLFDRARNIVESAPAIERMAFLLEMAVALLFLLWLQRPARLASIPPELRRAPFLRALGTAVRVATIALAVAIVADVAGWGSLGGLLGNAALRGGYLAFFVFVLLKVFTSLASFALVMRPLRLLRSISSQRWLVRRGMERVFTVIAVLSWASLALSQIGVLSAVTDLARSIFAASANVGAITVSLGDFIVFGLTVWLSFLLARLVDHFLKQDVFSRVSAGRGVPYAVSGLVRYTLIFLGFLVGLAAAGVEVSNLTVVAGGLGVGIGFGLQNVVNNFVSGLILLFERPVQVGDAVQLPEVWGNIERIGIRASVIRSFDGAEVIVPNGMLISEKVTNWTLSDRRRRVEVNVGVTYGTPAQKVIDLLLEVATSNDRVLKEPAPGAFFLAFGDSSLDFMLRVWIGSFEDGYRVRSDLAVAIQEALAAADISVPFPQRDLHVVSVSPDASARLGVGTAPPPPEPPKD